MSSYLNVLIWKLHTKGGNYNRKCNYSRSSFKLIIILSLFLWVLLVHLNYYIFKKVVMLLLCYILLIWNRHWNMCMSLWKIHLFFHDNLKKLISWRSSDLFAANSFRYNFIHNYLIAIIIVHLHLLLNLMVFLWMTTSLLKGFLKNVTVTPSLVFRQSSYFLSTYTRAFIISLAGCFSCWLIFLKRCGMILKMGFLEERACMNFFPEVSGNLNV